MLVVNPNNRLNSPFAAVEPPLWVGLIASFHDAEILDAEAENLTLLETELAIKNSGHKKIIIVVMGNNPSVSSTPKMPISETLADRLMDSLLTSTSLSISLTGLHPIAAGSKYPVVVKPFEDMPMQPWDKLPMGLYRAHNWHCLDGSSRSPYASVYTSLGCPYDCYYCNIHTLYKGRGIQYRPIEDILKEIAKLVNTYYIRNIKFWDELFTINEARVLEICEGLKRYQINAWAYARLDTVTEKMLAAMKVGGINWLAYGFENIKDKKFIRQAKDIVAMTKAAGISIIGNFMFGLPGTTREDDIAGVQFAKEHLLEFVNFYDAKPYPGSQWYEDEKPQLKWQNYSQYRKISNFRQKSFHEYFTNPAYLSMIQEKWGNQAVKQVEDMVAWRLQR